MITLYEFELSGNCHKIRLLLSFLKLDYKNHVLNGGAREHKSADFLALNSFGQVPVLTDCDIVIRDSQAILVYLARTYGPEEWFPINNTLALIQITTWFSVAANEITRGPTALRLHHKFGRVINVDEATRITTQLLEALNTHLNKHDWLAAAKITIADLALYPYLALAHEGHVDISLYPAVDAWLARIESVPGYVSMPGIRVHSHTAA